CWPRPRPASFTPSAKRSRSRSAAAAAETNQTGQNIMAEKPRLRVPSEAKKGDVIQIKTLMSHPMETGYRKDEAGKPIPREIINSFVCTFNGHEVFRADLEPAISANPYFEFTVKVEDSGT